MFIKALLMTATIGLSGIGFSEGNTEELKRQITKIAEQNQSRLDNFKEVREQLEPLVQELLAETNQTLEERDAGKIGAWQQLWTDDTDDTKPNSFFATVDRSRTFQVVSGVGHQTWE